MIMPRRSNDLVAAAKSVLTNDVWTHVRIGGIGEIAVRRAADEAGFARWVKPPLGRAVWNDDWRRTGGLLLTGLMVLLLTTATTATTATTTSATALWLVGAMTASAVPAPSPSATVTWAALLPILPALTPLLVLALPVAAAAWNVVGPIYCVIRLSVSAAVVTRGWCRIRRVFGFRGGTRRLLDRLTAAGIAVRIRIGGARLGFGIGFLARATATAGRTTRFGHCMEKKSAAKLGLIGGRCSYVARSSRASWSAVYCTRSGNPCPVPRTAGGAGCCLTLHPVWSDSPRRATLRQAFNRHGDRWVSGRR